MMKQILRFLTIAAIGSIFTSNASAQSFHVEDTVRSVISGPSELHNDVHNMTSNPIQVEWHVIYHNLPTDWAAAIGVCDNITCYGSAILGMPGPSKNMANIAANGVGPFDVQINATTLNAGGPYYVTAELNESSTKDTATFMFYKWPTGISNVDENNAQVVLYPNPVANTLHVKLTSDNISKVVITNAIGSIVSSSGVVKSREIAINVQSLPTGTYFMKLIDNRGYVSAVRKFIHQ